MSKFARINAAGKVTTIIESEQEYIDTREDHDSWVLVTVEADEKKGIEAIVKGDSYNYKTKHFVVSDYYA